jgi:hypothetical protein
LWRAISKGFSEPCHEGLCRVSLSIFGVNGSGWLDGFERFGSYDDIQLDFGWRRGDFVRCE